MSDFGKFVAMADDMAHMATRFRITADYSDLCYQSVEQVLEERRAQDREPCLQRVVIKFDEPGGRRLIADGVARNRSELGAGFLVDVEAAVGARCEVQWVGRGGCTRLHKGTVIYCCEVRGAGHALGVRFDKPVALHDDADRCGTHDAQHERL